MLEEEFVEIVVNVLDKEEGADRAVALLIADGVRRNKNSHYEISADRREIKCTLGEKEKSGPYALTILINLKE